MQSYEEVTSENAPELIAHVQRIAQKWARSRMNQDAADDVAADVMVNCLRSERTDLAALRERGELDRFIVTATRNAYRSRCRSENRRALYEGAFAAEPRFGGSYGMSTEDRCDYGDLTQAVQRALGRLWWWHRDVFLMVAEGEMTYGQVGAECGISPRKVEWIVRSTREKMKEHLAEYRAAALATRSKGKTPARRKTRGGGAR